MKERASKLLRRKLCPGSAVAERGLPDIDSEDAAEGTLLHAAWLTGTLEERIVLTDEQFGLLERASAMRDELARQVFGNIPKIGIEIADELYIESSALDLTGHLDVVMFSGKVGLIIDLKTGRI